ncbi:CYTH and CHAD domain-containing protein [Albimonas pacifica]|uniref:Inorganic triphosphatase YgiF, contains CYTH and CHAD domains n=1 Tax=Albimonas pacifica TaxID=1114924 RepID=A0A1I3CQV8_9RHOB|nr:CYTH and CHAD domain-containing protein [Albimonas pacifica]SFH76867.1 Inorganic triphosphatase YgiF, contains CYTH and CHAD domains [Albimonas pacifica]
MTEIELKFLLDEAGEAALRASPALRRLAQGAARRRKLRSIYFDTPDGDLRAHGFALRLRKVGRGWVQTVKAGAHAAGAGLFSMREAETPAPGGRLDLDLVPDPGLREAVRHVLGDAPLNPVFETLIDRTERVLAVPGGEVELAIDVGEVVAGDRRAGFREAELELKSGAPAAIYEVARALFEAVPARFSEMSKAGRGHALTLGRPALPPLEPRRARRPALDPAGTTEAAAARILRECLAQIDANAAVVLACDDPAGPHQLRVGLRRARSALSLFGPALAGPQAEALGAAARDLAAAAGELRDLDVLATEILGPAAALAPADAAGFEALAEAVAARRLAARQALRATLAGPQARRLLIDLSAFVELRGWLRPTDLAQTAQLARPAGETAAAALGKRWKKVRRQARELESLDVEARHELRKQLKKLRYGVDFFGPMWPGESVAPYARALRRLQNVFGSLNDIAMAEARLTGPGAPCADHPAAQRAVGRMLGRMEMKAEADWTRALARWEALAALKPFWK